MHTFTLESAVDILLANQKIYSAALKQYHVNNSLPVWVYLLWQTSGYKLKDWSAYTKIFERELWTLFLVF